MGLYSKQNVTADVGTGITRDSSGVTFDGTTNSWVKLVDLSAYSSSSFTVEVDVTAITISQTSGPFCVIVLGMTSEGSAGSCGVRINNANQAAIWRFRNTSNDWKDLTPELTGASYFDNAVLKFQVDYTNKTWALYKNDTLAGKNTNMYQNSNNRNVLILGTSGSGGQLGQNTIIRAVRVYAGVV